MNERMTLFCCRHQPSVSLSVLLCMLLAVLLGKGNLKTWWDGMSRGKEGGERRLEISVE